MTNPAETLVDLLDLEQIEVNIFRGLSPNESLQRVFGGQVAGQALADLPQLAAELDDRTAVADAAAQVGEQIDDGGHHQERDGGGHQHFDEGEAAVRGGWRLEAGGWRGGIQRRREGGRGMRRAGRGLARSAAGGVRAWHG